MITFQYRFHRLAQFRVGVRVRLRVRVRIRVSIRGRVGLVKILIRTVEV